MEGVEGAGKSTLVHRLESWLHERGHAVRPMREPGGTALGEALRRIVKDAELPMTHLSELLLFEAARHELVECNIRPALERVEVVLLDRFYDSTTAYQGYGRGLDVSWIENLNRSVCGSVVPHTTLLLDIDPSQGLLRAKNDDSRRPDAHDRDRFEQETLAFLTRVREGFLTIARREPERVAILDAGGEVESIWFETAQVLEARGY